MSLEWVIERASDTNTLAFMNGNSSCLVILLCFISFYFLNPPHTRTSIFHTMFPLQGFKDVRMERIKNKMVKSKGFSEKGQNKIEAIVFFKGVKHLRID